MMHGTRQMYQLGFNYTFHLQQLCNQRQHCCRLKNSSSLHSNHYRGKFKFIKQSAVHSCLLLNTEVKAPDLQVSRFIINFQPTVFLSSGKTRDVSVKASKLMSATRSCVVPPRRKYETMWRFGSVGEAEDWQGYTFRWWARLKFSISSIREMTQRGKFNEKVVIKKLKNKVNEPAI